jgi:hypothetical protein
VGLVAGPQIAQVLLMVLQIGFALAICHALQLFIADESEELADRLEIRQYYGNFLKTVYTMLGDGFKKLVFSTSIIGMRFKHI